ncbi:triacylglycerol lipase 2-like [Phoenix dactylifera]|uniref:Lipase n=1 Tax=Phoenix dactylifera TaxID=42345 RepID=A0A8B7C051_PHODC|nr:triacylglycerol lipase 2-like [Phoenix dactylifera]
MASNECLKFAWLLCFGLAIGGALGTRKELKLVDSTSKVGMQAPAPTPSTTNGTCKSRVEIYGYECEEHTVTTEDGYILSMQRIPNGRSGSPTSASKTPVLLQHGLLMDGITWLLNSPDESLGYILADNGYDVWIANTRGTIYSLGHTSLSPDDSAYWDWSWDELVAYDLPATFKYVYKQTGQQKIHYVGHSLGTLIALASFCEQNLLSMLRSAALLSPIAYMNQLSSPIARGAAKSFVAEAYCWLGLDEFDPNGEAVHKFLTTLCKQPGINCYDLMTTFTGKNCCLNSSSVDVFLDHEPQPTATKNMVHLAQMIRRGTITKYDYNNDDENMKHYGQTTPPAYNMSSIPNNLPLFLSYGGQDELSDVADVRHLLNSLKFHDGSKWTTQYVENYAHADFVMAVDAKQVVYNPLMAFFKLQ